MAHSDDLPGFIFYVMRWLTSERVKAMTLEQQGAFVKLLCHQWIERSVPSDAIALAGLWQVPMRSVRRIWKGPLRDAFVPLEGRPGRLVNMALERERDRVLGQKEKKSAAGLAGAEARWRSHTDRNAIAFRPQCNSTERNSPPTPTAAKRAQAQGRNREPADADLMHQRWFAWHSRNGQGVPDWPGYDAARSQLQAAGILESTPPKSVAGP